MQLNKMSDVCVDFFNNSIVYRNDVLFISNCRVILNFDKK